jgi:3-hydroxymyristoyl/3-hydroxydecanoyl-(acyl carrier protein) dehydratase
MSYRFIDRVVALDLGPPATIRVAKTFPPSDPCLSGPVHLDRVPASMILEALAMSGGHLIFRQMANGAVPLLLKVEGASFSRSVLPGELLEIRAELLAISHAPDNVGIAQTRGEVLAGEDRVAEARLLYLCVHLPGLHLEKVQGTHE